MISSMSEERRIKFTLKSYTTERLITLRGSLMREVPPRSDLLKLVEEELGKRPDFLPVK